MATERNPERSEGAYENGRGLLMAARESITAKAYELAAARLDPEMAVRVAVLLYVLSLYGINAQISSGYRDLAYQAQLYNRWKWGEKGIYKPARFSWHTNGRAVDIPLSGPDLDLAVYVWKWLGGRWGGDFSNPDPVHFDLPGPVPPLAAY